MGMVSLFLMSRFSGLGSGLLGCRFLSFAAFGRKSAGRDDRRYFFAEGSIRNFCWYTGISGGTNPVAKTSFFG
jgi:hypothetical protein